MSTKSLGGALLRFLAHESAAGGMLGVAALAALVASNSPLGDAFHALWQAPLEFGFAPLFGAQRLGMSLHDWINDLGMAIFFLLVGLEIKRELVEGELSTPAQAALPAVAALGGMALPALVYAALNAGDAAALRGWAIPMATDIAFALGVLTLLGRRVPTALKVFLAALAIIDDLGAIAVIALFYAADLDAAAALAAGVLAALLWAMNRLRVTRLDAFLAVGALLWVCVLKSGIHPTVAGVLTAIAIPARDRAGASPLERAEHALHPWVAFGILPLFALANAGVSFHGLRWADALGSVPLGIAAGLVAGKAAGVGGASAAWLRWRGAGLPAGVGRLQFAGVCLLCGIGFTMSLFIGALAFDGAGPAREVALKIGVLGGSLVAGTLGALLLLFAPAAPASAAPAPLRRGRRAQ